MTHGKTRTSNRALLGLVVGGLFLLGIGVGVGIGFGVGSDAGRRNAAHDDCEAWKVSWQIFSGRGCLQTNVADVRVFASTLGSTLGDSSRPFYRLGADRAVLFPVDACVDVTASSRHFRNYNALDGYPRMLRVVSETGDAAIGWNPHIFSCDADGELSQVAYRAPGCDGDPISTPVHVQNTEHLANRSVAEQETTKQITRMRTAPVCGYQETLNMSYWLRCMRTCVYPAK